MSKSISCKPAGFDSEYILEEQADGIIVKVPYLDTDDEGYEVIDHNIVEIKNGKKADIVRQFFIEESDTIIRDGTAYVLDELIFDETSVPANIEPDIIVDWPTNRPPWKRRLF